MPFYAYTAAGKDGVIVRGEREAENPRALAAALRAEGVLLLRTEEPRRAHAGENVLVRINSWLARFSRVKLTDRMFFSRNLGVMLKAGLPMSRALEALAEETANHRFGAMLADVNRAITKGESFATALRRHERVFGELFISMAEVGETTGKLPLILHLLARQMKKDYDLRRRVIGAMIYPAIIISALAVIGLLMMVYVVPTIVEVIRDLGADLPLSTRIVIVVSDILSRYTLFAVLGLAGAGFLIWRLLKTSTGKRVFDTLALRAPLIGSLVKKFNMAQFSRTLMYLLTSGVPVVRSLEITSHVLGSTPYRTAVAAAAGEMQKGRELHVILGEYPKLFDRMVIQMLSVGEETGKVSEMLLRLATFFEEDVAATTKNLSTIIEPILMLVVGGAVAFFAISMLQPIYGSLGNL